MLISEPYHVLPYIYWFLSKTIKYDGNILISPSTFRKFSDVFLRACVRDDAIGGTMEESGSDSQVK